MKTINKLLISNVQNKKALKFRNCNSCDNYHKMNFLKNVSLNRLYQQQLLIDDYRNLLLTKMKYSINLNSFYSPFHRSVSYFSSKEKDIKIKASVKSREKR